MKMWESYFLNGQIVGIDLFRNSNLDRTKTELRYFLDLKATKHSCHKSEWHGRIRHHN